MTNLATRLLEDSDAAEDVVQRVFIKALSKARSDPDAIERIRKPQAWLLRTTRNMASGVLRTEARRRRRRAGRTGTRFGRTSSRSPTREVGEIRGPNGFWRWLRECCQSGSSRFFAWGGRE